jgi:23S rRNA (uracil1939-C5)-methyltransferase
MDKPRKDDVIELTIEDIGFEGKGIGRYNGEFVVFVPNTVPGDSVKARIKRTKKNYADAKLEEILVSSDKRVIPQCVYFGTCNGCKMQSIDYSFQLEIKRNAVINAFERIGGFKELNIPEVMGSENIYFYRNKLEFSFSNNRWLTDADMLIENIDKSFAVGYHIPGFIDKILDIHSCELQSETSNRILNLTRDFFKVRNTSVYSTKTHSGYLRFLTVRQSANTPDLMVNLITHDEDNEMIDEYARDLKERVPEITTLINSVSKSKAQVAQADYLNVIFGSGFIEEQIGNYRFKIMPHSFFQTNSVQSKTLFDTALEFAEFNKNENVLDLYCGCGAISLYVSGYVNKVYGVELSEESIKMANENAVLNNVTNCEFEAKDVREFLIDAMRAQTMNYDTIILDPPRSGLHPDVIKSVLEYGAKKIMYVSCNPTTQARDLQLMAERYKITKIQPVDMFPHTFHIENVVRLDLND